ncbi:MAG: crossover junction endodeoxyribonuclease RuvC [Anaerolineaceae bacterium]|jgi:crossover junction endodeoxyribonuclease RuvC|nr:crossover junction endodeoxyribonuclease RuvC [Anaerolineaceae bacterium]
MLVIGLDPGTATTGYGIIEENDRKEIRLVTYGIIATPAGLAAEQRLLAINQQLSELLLLHRPDFGAVEKLFFQKNVTTAIAVGQARGVILLSLAQQSIPLAEYTPNEVKQAVTGYGSADKKQVQEMVRTILQLPAIPKPDDAADALAIALCHLQSRAYQRLESIGGA